MRIFGREKAPPQDVVDRNALRLEIINGKLDSLAVLVKSFQTVVAGLDSSMGTIETHMGGVETQLRDLNGLLHRELDSPTDALLPQMGEG